MAALDDVCCAAVPEAALALLGDLRTRPGVRVRVEPAGAWLYWEPGDAEVLQRVLGLEGALVFARRGGLWYRPGQHLPSFAVPDGEGARPLIGVLTPAPTSAAVSAAPAYRRVALGLVRDG